MLKSKDLNTYWVVQLIVVQGVPPKKMVNREKTEKKESISKNHISEFVNLALASSKMQEIRITQQNGEYSLRPNLNIFIYGQIGGTKSTLLNQISNQTNSQEPYTDLTYPALIGSIDSQTKQLLIGACWQCRNSLMLLDEFDFGKRKKDDVRALLQLIEGGKYNRKLAAFSAPHEEIDEDLSFNFKSGTFQIKTRFSLIIVTMKYPYTSTSPETQALVSRSICLPWYPQIEDLKKVAQGYSIFDYKDLAPKNLKVKINLKTWNLILDYVMNQTTHPNYLRIAGDCARIYAILGKHRNDLYDILIKLGSKKFQSKTPKK